MQNQENNINEANEMNESPGQQTDIKAENEANTDGNSASDKAREFEQKANELNDKYLRLYSEFDNYRKRSIKEKADLIKTAAEDVFKAVLPVIDDFERAIKANENAEDIQAIKEGIHLIYNKLKNTTQQKGLQSFDSIGKPFDADTMEAITHIPAQDPSQKGTIVDEIEKGYKLGDKVIRFAKVVVAQ